MIKSFEQSQQQQKNNPCIHRPPEH